MGEYMAVISVPEGELDEIMEKLHEAQETIYQCYRRLESMGVLRVEKKSPTGAADGE